ncbi:hypothetical protein [Saccharothrix hoggarensis]|uniref:Excreted virulence factor EspC (Type VII ESX diderm) n=1 Tax=Saccharothrix hoggarensis TaxID=913853 RepID=A0ABW3R5I2_9PSEU
MSDFQTDLADLENGLRHNIVPAVERFTRLVEDVEKIEDHHPAALMGGGLMPGALALVPLYAAASTALVESQRAAVRSLEEFREALEDVVRTYRSVEEANADGFRGRP